MNLIPLPAFQDNHLWILHYGRRALAMDPGDPQPVLACLQRDGLQLEAILVTHHHVHHMGNVNAVREARVGVFSGSRDRVFEGTRAQMLSSRRKFAVLPGSTRLCSAHGYSLRKLKLAHMVEPLKAKLIHSLQRCESVRAHKLSTLPETIEQEKRINPFLRTRRSGVTQLQC